MCTRVKLHVDWADDPNRLANGYTKEKVSDRWDLMTSAEKWQRFKPDVKGIKLFKKDLGQSQAKRQKKEKHSPDADDTFYVPRGLDEDEFGDDA